MITIKAFTFNPFRQNGFLVWDEEGSCVAVDPGCYEDSEYAAVEEVLAKEGLTLKAIWLTHGHFDHIFGVARLQRDHSAPVYMSTLDQEILDRDAEFAHSVDLIAPDVAFTITPLHDGDILDTLKGSPFKAIATPGHTNGGFCFYDEADKVLFSGDTLFAGTIGRTDLFGGEYDKIIVSIMDTLMGLPGDVDVLPGHGGRTSIADERTHNPFLQPFNEPEEEQIDWDGDGLELHPVE